MTDPIAPDALREAVAEALWNDAAHDSDHEERYSWGYLTEHAALWPDNYGPIRDAWYRTTDAVLAVVAKHRDAEVERVDADTLEHLRREASEWRRHICPVERVVLDQGLDIIRERDDAQDRIARALLTVSHHSKTAAILRGDE